MKKLLEKLRSRSRYIEMTFSDRTLIAEMMEKMNARIEALEQESKEREKQRLSGYPGGD